MSFLKTKQLQAVCPLHAPTILPRLLLFCTNHLVEACTAARGQTPMCSAGEKSRNLPSGKPPLNRGSHWRKIFFFVLKLSFGSFCTFFFFALKFPSKFSNMEFAPEAKFLACQLEVWLVLLVLSALFRIQTPVLHEQPRYNNTKKLWFRIQNGREKILSSRF